MNFCLGSESAVGLKRQKAKLPGGQQKETNTFHILFSFLAVDVVML